MSPAARDKPLRRSPAEWNYYGDMTSGSVNAIKVVGVQTAPDKIYPKADAGVAATAAIGAALTYQGNIADVNSEGSPPATQFFIQSLTLRSGAAHVAERNGVEGRVPVAELLPQHQSHGGWRRRRLRLPRHAQERPGASINLPGFDDPAIIGVICRYYLYHFSPASDYVTRFTRASRPIPRTLEIAGTFAPLYATDKIVTGPVGRLMVSNVCNIPTPSDTGNNSASTTPTV